MSILLKQAQNENDKVNANDTNPSTLSSMSNPSPSNTTINRGERHPIMDQSIAIDNNTLNSIINSILQTKNDSNNGKEQQQQQQQVLNQKEPPPDLNKNGTTGADGESTQQYLLPVDLLISVDKSQHATVKAALPSTFAFQQPMISTLPLQFATASTTPLPSIPMVPSTAGVGATPSLTFTPSVNAYQPPLTPALTTPTGLPSVPMVPSIPMSLLSQPQMPIISNPMTMNTMNTMNINQFMPQQIVFPQHHQQNKSTLNPSAQTFTPTTTYSAFGHNMNKIAPISEICNNDEEKVKESIHAHNNNGDGDEFINDEADAWYMIDEKSNNNIKNKSKSNIAHSHLEQSHPQQQPYKPPIPIHSHSNNNTHNKTADSLSPQTTAITSPSFKRKSRYFNNHEDDSRQYNKSWRNFGNKRDNKVTLPPRWRNNDQTSSPLSFRSNNPIKPSHSYSFHPKYPKPIKLLVEFVKHVTLPNRENYPANTVLTKTWAMKNSGDHEWGYNVELAYCKGDKTLSLYDRYPVINAQPGQTVEISATIKTSNIPGRYCTYFRLRKNDRFFGPRVWVDIIVAGHGDKVLSLEPRATIQCAKDVKDVNDNSPKASKWKKKYSAIVACK